MSARQRRVNGPPAPIPPTQQSQQAQSRPVDMTLPMVLQLLETRLRKLEQQSVVVADISGQSVQSDIHLREIVSEWKEFQSEYDSRFNILVTEINQLKDIVMKLQAYTMDVNKTLLEERVNFMAEEKENIVFSSTAE